MTRPCRAGQTAIMALLVRSGWMMTTSVCRSRKFTSPMNDWDAQPPRAVAATARAIRRLMDVAYRIRPLAGRLRSPRQERRGPSRGGGRGRAHVHGGRQAADQLPGRHEQDRLLGAGRVELLAERDED